MFLDAGWWAGVSGIVSILALVGAAIAVWQVFDGFSSKPASGLRSKVTHKTVEGNDEAVEVIVHVRMLGSGTIYEVSWLTNLPHRPDLVLPSMTCDSAPIEYSWIIQRDLLRKALVGLTWVEPRYGRPVRRANRWGVDFGETRYEAWVHPPFSALTSRLGLRGHWKDTTRSDKARPDARIPPIDG